MARQDLTYFEGELSVYPLDLLARSILLDLGQSSFRSFLGSIEAYRFLRELYKHNIS